MPLLLLLSNDETLHRDIERMLAGRLESATVLRFSDMREARGCADALGSPDLTFLDTRLEEREECPFRPCLHILPEGVSPADNSPALSLPLRPVETLSLIRLLLSPGAATDSSVSRGRKFEAIARFQSGLAHDLNNCLTTLLGNLEFLPARIPDEPEMLADLRGACDDAAALIRLVQTFTRRDPLPSHPLRLGELLRNCHASARRLCGPSCSLEMLLPEEDVMVLGDESRIEQILLNWMACTAPDVPRLFVRVEPGEDQVLLHLSVPDGYRALPGDSSAYPGLLCTRGLLQSACLAVQESPTCLELAFPRADIPPSDPPRSEPAAPLRLLVAESHPELLSCLNRCLQNAGHRVELAGDLPELLHRLHAFPLPDRLLVDAQLRGGGARALRAAGVPASLPCIWLLPSAEFRAGLPLSAPTLPKPFSPSQLLAILRSEHPTPESP